MNRGYRELGLASILLASTLACTGSREQQPTVPTAQTIVEQVPPAPEVYFTRMNTDCFFTEFGKYRALNSAYGDSTPTASAADFDNDGDADVLLVYSGLRDEDFKMHLVLCENRISDKNAPAK